MNAPYELTAKEKEWHTRVIVMNILFIIACALIFDLFTLSNYNEIQGQVDVANTALAKEDGYRTQGVTFADYKRLVNTYQVKKVSFDDSEADLITEALRKDPSSPLDYMKWVEWEVSSGALSRYDEIEQKNSAIIGNILPVIGDPGDTGTFGVQKHIVTLATLTRYIEESLLKKFAIDSVSPISINEVTYDSTKTPATNIGSFVVSLDVTGKNTNIITALSSIQSSGKLSVENGSLVSPAPVDAAEIYSGLSNLLIGIDLVEAKNALSRNDSLNSATIKLRFYVKGRSYSTYLQIKSLVVEKFGKLKTDVAATLTKFKNQAPKTDEQMDAVSDVRNLSAQLASISTRIDDIQKSGKVTEFAGQFDSLLSVFSSLNTIADRFEKDMVVISKQ